MSTKSKPITVRILDQDFRIACDPGEEDGLLASARFLNGKMQELRASGKVLGAERVAVMAALNITHEFLHIRDSANQPGSTVNQRVRSLRERVESALTDSNQLEL
ncbi:MAG: cell division protein ZapA [Pseudomonadota bacterium]